jgi:L-alanine-DL-glutamate epimerase-like enolase superfamily enzyme
LPQAKKNPLGVVSSQKEKIMIKIIDLQIREVHLPLTEPYTIAYETVAETTNLFLEITTSGGLKGFGCAAPDLEVTGETSSSVLSRFEKIVAPYLEGKSPFRIAHIMTELRLECPGSPALLAMVDMALHDLLARKAGLPLYQVLGGYRSSMPTSITIGILPVKESLEKAVQFYRQGFRILKVKGGLAAEMDIERIHRIREKLGKSIAIRFDANQGYSVEETIHFVRETRQCDIEILEQPTPREELEALGEVTRQTHLPVMADESLLTLPDAFHIARNNWADMINIKLMKTGGIAQALHINSVARAAGMEAMVGCMDESALSISAGLHFALSRPNVEFADLDGHLDLLDDPAAGCIRLKDGVLFPNERPGLGVEGLALFSR